jgi:putative membrane protein
VPFCTPQRLTTAKPTDPQIAHVAYTAGQLDIDAAKQALDKSKNKDVRAFAQQMIGDHTTVNNQALALVKNSRSSQRTIPPAKALPRKRKPPATSLRA